MKLLSRDTLKYFSHQNLPRSLRKSEINFEQRSWLTHRHNPEFAGSFSLSLETHNISALIN